MKYTRQAYVVMDAYDNGTVVDGTDTQDAWRAWLELNGDCEVACTPHSCECHTLGDGVVRAPEFDAYVGKEVPLEVYCKAGWRYPCWFCADAGYHDPVEEWSVVDGKAVCFECQAEMQRCGA